MPRRQAQALGQRGHAQWFVQMRLHQRHSARHNRVAPGQPGGGGQGLGRGAGGAGVVDQGARDARR